MSESLSTAERKELCELIHALRDGRITPEQSARLEAWVCENEEARWIYVQYMNLCGILSWEGAADTGGRRTVPNTGDKTGKSPILGFLGDVFQAGASFLGKSVVMTLLFTIGLPGLILTLLALHIGSQPAPNTSVPDPLAPIAQISKTHCCKWAEDAKNWSEGDAMPAGRRLQLSEGLVELTFVNGASVILEGPATFAVESTSRGFLYSGKLVAHAPERAAGFTVGTPTATIVDLGTDFGVLVKEDRTVEGHVFNGKVEMAVRCDPGEATGAPVRLEAGEAVRVVDARDGSCPRMAPIAIDHEQFIRRFPPAVEDRKIRFVHRGENDPVTEGWEARVFQGRTKLSLKLDRTKVGPVHDGGVAAWRMANDVNDREIQYAIVDQRQFTDTMMEQGRKKGWVMRARIKVDDVGNDVQSCCHFTFFDGGGRGWSVQVKLDQNGQCLVLAGASSLGSRGRVPVANSRDRYVDYEVRYNPATKDAEVRIDGRQVATEFVNDESAESAGQGNRGLRFGLARHAAKAKFALVEWEVLD